MQASDLGHLSHWKKTSAIVHEQQSRLAFVAELRHFSQLCWLWALAGLSNHLSLTNPRTACGCYETAQGQHHHQPLFAGWGGWKEPVPCLLLTNPILKFQMELSVSSRAELYLNLGGGWGGKDQTPSHFSLSHWSQGKVLVEPSTKAADGGSLKASLHLLGMYAECLLWGHDHLLVTAVRNLIIFH